MSASKMTIGALATQTNCTVPTIRYYEQIGLLPRPERAENGHRYYRDGDLKRLIFIKRCRDFGFPIEQVRDLAKLVDDGGRPCAEVRDLAQLHLDQVRAKLEEMRLLETNLLEFIGGCDASCIGGTTKDCVIISDITAMAAPASCTPRSCRRQAPQVAAGERSFATELKRK